MIDTGGETDKAILRRVAFRARKSASLSIGESKAADLLAKAFPDELIHPGVVVAGFLPINDEIDPRPLMARLVEGGCSLCLPVVSAKNRPLRFLSWELGGDLELGPYRTEQPPSSNAIVEPDIFIIPMLAYDARGHRLGYGGGYYDRTLEAIREARDLIAVGIAYSAQEMKEVPITELDQPVDWIVTEKGAAKVEK